MNARSFALRLLASVSAAVSLTGVSRAEALPKWVETGRCPDSDAFVCAIGISDPKASQEDARSAAWTNALIMMARRHLPFLQSVRESSEETLVSASFKRAAQLDTQEVDWSKIEEDTSNQSPYLRKINNGKWQAYVLLRWSRAAIKGEIKRLKDLASSERSTRIATQFPIGDTSAGVGQLRVNTVPAGATIVLSGYTIGTSNAIINGVGKGTHEIIIKLPGYETIVSSVAVNPGQKLTRDFTLKKLSKTIVIKSTPADAVVFLNNQVAGFKTGEEATLDHGVQSLRVEKLGFFPESRVVNVDEQLESIEFELRPKPGFITVLADVKRASVEIDGRLVGTTDLLNLMVQGGKHKVRVFKDGYEDFKTNIYVTGASSKAVVANLRYLAGSDASSTLTPKSRSSELMKSTLATLGTALAIGVAMNLNEKTSKVDRSSCDAFIAASSKARCNENADTMDKKILDANKQRETQAIVFGLSSILCFGFSIKM
jgi:hypothetical protein